jgi:hypothetical protein
MNANYSTICDHGRLQRLNGNFVRCSDCGQSMISQINIPSNKTRHDFTNENKSFIRNFDRNFSNVLEEKENQQLEPLYEYYTDRMMINVIVVDRRVKFDSNPPKFEVIVNGSKSYLTNDDIIKLLADSNAFRVDPALIKNAYSRF